MAFPLAGVASAISAGAQLGSLLFGGDNSQASIAAAQLQEARNQAQYQRLLNALLLQRSSAGYSDNLGNRVSYSPGDNTWRTVLSPQNVDAFRSYLAAVIDRNSRGLSQANRTNDRAEGRAIRADDAAGRTLNDILSYRDQSPRELASLLGRRAVEANNETTRPIVADTLRQFARTGTNAGPVLADLQRTSYNNLRKGLMDSEIQARTTVPSINAQNRNNLLTTLRGLSIEANPQYQNPNVATYDPTSTFASLVANRANGATAGGGAATYGNVGIGNLLNNAYSNASSNIANPTGARIRAFGSAGQNLFESLFSPQPETTNAGRSTWDRLIDLFSPSPSYNNADLLSYQQRSGQGGP